MNLYKFISKVYSSRLSSRRFTFVVSPFTSLMSFFNVSKPNQPQYKPIYVYLEVKNGRWTIKYSRKEGDNTEISESETGDYEQIYLKCMIKCLTHFQQSHRPLIIHLNNVYLKTCINEWIDKWAKNDFENRPHRELFKEIYSLKSQVKLENVVLVHEKK